MSIRSYFEEIKEAVRQQWLISQAIQEGIRARVEEKKE